MSAVSRCRADFGEESLSGLFPRGEAGCLKPGGRADARSQLLVFGEAAQGSGKPSHVAGLDEEPLPLVAGQIGEVAGPPAHHRQARGHGLPVDRAIWFTAAGQDEHVCIAVQRRHLWPAQAPVALNPVAEVAAGQPAVNPRGIPGIGPVVAGEVEPREPGRQFGDGLKHLEDAFAGDPVADA